MMVRPVHEITLPTQIASISLLPPSWGEVLLVKEGRFGASRLTGNVDDPSLTGSEP
jgi:hypothetical protein